MVVYQKNTGDFKSVCVGDSYQFGYSFSINLNKDIGK